MRDDISGEHLFDEEIQKARDVLINGFKRIALKAFAFSETHRIQNIEVMVNLGEISVSVLVHEVKNANATEVITVRSSSAKEVRDKINSAGARYSASGCPNGDFCLLDQNQSAAKITEQIARA